MLQICRVGRAGVTITVSITSIPVLVGVVAVILAIIDQMKKR